MMKKDRNQFIDIMHGIAMLLVAFFFGLGKEVWKYT